MRSRSKNLNKRRVGSLLAVLSFTSYMPICSLPAFAAMPAIADNALPVLDNAINGTVGMDATKANQMNVQVNGGIGSVGQFDWKTFNVGKDSTVNWVFSANSQTALNRVMASGGLSQIYGKLTNSSSTNCPECVASGKVILINPSGILFGNGSQVDLNSFTASTFDVKGAKNISAMTEAEKASFAGSTYQSGDRTYQNGGLVNIAGYNKTVTFESNNNMVNGDGYIKADGTGTKLASIVANGSKIGTTDTNTIALVGNNIDIQNSTLKTHYSSTPNAVGNTQTISRIKLVTADGVNFYYESPGNTKLATNSTTREVSKKVAGQEYGINISNSTLQAGDIDIINDTKSSDLKISDSKVYTKKLQGGTYTSASGTTYTPDQTGEFADLDIKSAGTVKISSSDVQTTNQYNSTTGQYTTTNMPNGIMTIQANDDVSIKNSQVRTGDSKTASRDANGNIVYAGTINITSANGNVDIVKDTNTNLAGYDNTAVAAAGNLNITAKENVNINGYDKIQAHGQGTANQAMSNQNRTMIITAKNANLTDTYLQANNVKVDAAENLNVKTSDIAGNNTRLYAKNTTLDGGTSDDKSTIIQYNTLAFHDGTGNKVNNVTIKNNTRFNDKDSDGLALSTNGNLTVDNSGLWKQTRDTSKSTRTVSSINNQNSVSLESTGGNVTIQNGRGYSSIQSLSTVDINAKNNVTLNDALVFAQNGEANVTATDGNITLTKSDLDANNAAITLTAGKKVTASNSKVLAEGKTDQNLGNININQGSDMNLTSDFTNSTIGATNKINLSSDGNITSSYALAKGTAPGGNKVGSTTNELVSLNNDANTNTHYIFRGQTGTGLEVNAGKSINTPIASAQGVDFVAAQNINVTSTGDMDLTNVSTKAGGDTKVKAAGDLKVNSLEIKGGNKTTLEGKTVKTPTGAINANNNKLAVNADGVIDINVKGVQNANKGLEINAEIDTHNGSLPALNGRDVTVNATDGKLAVSKIKAEELTLKGVGADGSGIIAAAATITPTTDNVVTMTNEGQSTSGKAYIEVGKAGGFNLDATTDYNNGNSGIYTGGNYNTIDHTDTGKVYGEVYDDTANVQRTAASTNTTYSNVRYERTGNVLNEHADRQVESTPYETTYTEWSDPVDVFDADGNKIGTQRSREKIEKFKATDKIEYETAQYADFTTKSTTEKVVTPTYHDWNRTETTTENQHVATLGSNGTANNFVLVYSKTSTDNTNGTEFVGNRTEGGVTTTTNASGWLVNGSLSTDSTLAVKGVEYSNANPAPDEVVRTPDLEPICYTPEEREPEGPAVVDIDTTLSTLARVPRHAEGTSNAAPIQNDLADTTGTVVQAAARLQLDEMDSASETTTEDDEDFDY